MNQFSDLAQTRRSIRKYALDPIDPDQVVQILQTALMAPTSKGKCSWQFIVVDEKELLQKLAHCKPMGASFIADAALAIVLLGDPLLSDVWIEDASVAATFIQLQAEDLNLGSCWVQVRERSFSDELSAADYVRSVLHIPHHLQVLCILPIGLKAQLRNPLDVENLHWEKIHTNQYRD